MEVGILTILAILLTSTNGNVSVDASRKHPISVANQMLHCHRGTYDLTRRRCTFVPSSPSIVSIRSRIRLKNKNRPTKISKHFAPFFATSTPEYPTVTIPKAKDLTYEGTNGSILNATLPIEKNRTVVLDHDKPITLSQLYHILRNENYVRQEDFQNALRNSENYRTTLSTNSMGAHTSLSSSPWTSASSSSSPRTQTASSQENRVAFPQPPQLTFPVLRTCTILSSSFFCLFLSLLIRPNMWLVTFLLGAWYGQFIVQQVFSGTHQDTEEKNRNLTSEKNSTSIPKNRVDSKQQLVSLLLSSSSSSNLPSLTSTSLNPMDTLSKTSSPWTMTSSSTTTLTSSSSSSSSSSSAGSSTATTTTSTPTKSTGIISNELFSKNLVVPGGFYGRWILFLGKKLASLYLNVHHVIQGIWFMYRTGQLSYEYYKVYAQMDQKYHLQEKMDAWNARFMEGKKKFDQWERDNEVSRKILAGLRTVWLVQEKSFQSQKMRLSRLNQLESKNLWVKYTSKSLLWCRQFLSALWDASFLGGNKRENLVNMIQDIRNQTSKWNVEVLSQRFGGAFAALITVNMIGAMFAVAPFLLGFIAIFVGALYPTWIRELIQRWKEGSTVEERKTTPIKSNLDRNQWDLSSFLPSFSWESSNQRLHANDTRKPSLMNDWNTQRPEKLVDLNNFHYYIDLHGNKKWYRVAQSRYMKVEAREGSSNNSKPNGISNFWNNIFYPRDDVSSSSRWKRS